MILLTIDTSTSCCSVALAIDGALAGEYLLALDRTLSERLLAAVDGLLNAAGLAVSELDGFGVALGPGSFTGLRVGVATAKGLALATGKPVAGFSSLAMLAGNLAWTSHPVCPLFDARKNEVYAGLYRCDPLPTELMADTVTPPLPFLDRLDGPVVFVGEGAVRYRALITERLGERALFAPVHLHSPRAAAGAELAATLFAQGKAVSAAGLLPVYIRPSEAELARRRREAP